MEIEINTADVEAFARSWKNGPAIVREELTKGMTRSILGLERVSKQGTPVKTGTLRRSITHQIKPAGTSVTGIVGTNVPYAKYVHEGTSARVIVPTNKKALFWKGAQHPVRRVNHPGTKANPFLRKALAQHRSAILKEMRSASQRIAQRLRSGA